MLLYVLHSHLFAVLSYIYLLSILRVHVGLKKARRQENSKENIWMILTGELKDSE